MTAKHTPGPWEVGKAATCSVWVGDTQVASCNWTIECPDCGSKEADYRVGKDAFNPTEVREANARLIAAAPDLLEACKLLYAELVNDNADLDCVKQAAHAIAKAEGL